MSRQNGQNLGDAMEMTMGIINPNRKRIPVI
jgi:hypothetical protein